MDSAMVQIKVSGECMELRGAGPGDVAIFDIRRVEGVRTDSHTKIVGIVMHSGYQHSVYCPALGETERVYSDIIEALGWLK